MSKVTLTNIVKNVKIKFDGQKISLPIDIQQKVDTYWNELLANGKKLRRGEVFTVTHKNKYAKYLKFTVSETDYAHYLYSQNIGGLGKYAVHIIHSAALVESSDNKIIFGTMNKHTSRPGIIQCCGGGIDRNDIVGGYFNLDGNTSNELKEELGIDIEKEKIVSTFKPAFFKKGGQTDKITVIYRVKLIITADNFLNNYSIFEKKLKKEKEDPEFEKIIVIEKEKDILKKFVDENKSKLDEYMPALLLFVADIK